MGWALAKVAPSLSFHLQVLPELFSWLFQMWSLLVSRQTMEEGAGFLGTVQKMSCRSQRPWVLAPLLPRAARLTNSSRLPSAL